MAKSLKPSVAGIIAAVIAIAVLQMLLPDSVTIGPLWLVPAIELSGIPVAMALLRVRGKDDRHLGVIVTIYLGILVSASIMNALLLLASLLLGAPESGAYLLFAGFAVLMSNALSFGIVYWWLDAGGPVARAMKAGKDPDFLFPQQSGETEWMPSLIDYVFTAYTNIIAFSPTDTMPLKHRVKLLFIIQSSTALVTIVVTLSRAINLIPQG